MALPSLKPDIRPFILCIEDNEMYLRLRKAVLEEAGYTVLSATNETEALEVLSEAPVCLVLSDHMLRGTTGTELAKRMKEMKREVPIIVYSGRVPETLRHVDGFINKDEPVANFLSLIHEFVKRYWE
ncbi:MAG TPA: response regulator [Terriglobales bacterium]|nr:response regulator [Terriglobales bacterium]